MSKNCYIDVDTKNIAELVDGIKQRNKDSVIVLPAMGGMETISPSKRKKCHRLKLEVLIPEDAIVGQEAISDFGGFVVLRLPKSRIEEKFLSGVEKDGK